MPAEENQPDLRHRHQDYDRHFRSQLTRDSERRLLPSLQGQEGPPWRRRNLRTEKGRLRRLGTTQAGSGRGRPSVDRRLEEEPGEEASLPILGFFLFHPQRNVPSQDELLRRLKLLQVFKARSDSFVKWD